MAKILLNSIKCYDNGGKTVDRYTVIMNAHGDYLAMNEHPFHPQGFGQHGEDCRPGKHLGKRIKFDDLPEDCKTLVRSDLRNSYQVAIVDSDGDGDVVRTSAGYAGIVRHAQDFESGITLEANDEMLIVRYPNGDWCSVAFPNEDQLHEWVDARINFGRGKFELFECNPPLPT